MARIKNVSYLTPEFINGLVERHGFNPQTLRGGDFEAAKTEAIGLTQDHRFINPKHKLTALNAIQNSKNMQMLYMALFNVMRAKTHPNEKLSDYI